MAICGGELGSILADEAIDEIVQKAGGCVIRLEELTVEALHRAARKGAVRATVVDVVSTPRSADAEEEDEVMPASQQPLRFAIEEEGLDEDVSWGDDGDDRSVEWGDEPVAASDEAEEDEEWQADDAEDDDEWQAEDEDEEELSWDAAPPRPDRGAELLARDLDDEIEEEETDEPAQPRAAAVPARRRLAGPAILSLAACLALVWAANQMPGPDSNERRGRDSVMFAERLSSEPSQIMRLARNAEAADADAHVHVWEAQPPRPVVASRPASEPVAVAAAKPAEPAAEPKKNAEAKTEAVTATAPADEFVGPLPQRPAEVEVTAPAAKPAAKNDAVVASAGTRPAPAGSAAAKTSPAKSAPAKPAAVASANRKGPVYTVQLGAFKARRNAEEMATRLRGKSPRILQEGGLYRVMSGSFASKKDATIHEASLRRAGYTTYVRTAVF
jgi:cell division protein FtsN